MVNVARLNLCPLLHCLTIRSNLEMEPEYLAKSDVQLNPNILRSKNDKIVL